MIEANYEGWVPLNKRPKLSFGHILAIASCNLIAGNIYNIVFLYLVPQEVELKIPNVWRSIILLMSSIIGFIVTPLVGFYSDRILLQFGRRRIFIIIGLFLGLVSLLLVVYCIEISDFIIPTGSLVFQRIIFVIGVFFAITAANLIQLPSRVLCSDVCPSSQLILMANVCQTYNGAAPLITNVLTGFKLYNLFNLSKDSLSIISLSFVFASSVISFISTHEEPLYVHPPKISPFKGVINSFKKMPKPFKRVIIIYFFVNMAVYQYIFTFQNFVSTLERFENDDDKAYTFSVICLAMNNLVQLIYGFCNFKICEWFGMKWTMIIGNGLLTVSLILFLFEFDNIFVYIALSGLIGISNVIFMAIPSAIVSIVIPSEELGVNFGILNCFLVLAQQVSNCLFGFGLTKLSPAQKIGYSFVPAFLATVASFWILEPTAIDNANYTQIQEESKTTGNGDRFIVC